MTVDLLDTLCQTETQGSTWRHRLSTAESLSALVWIGFEMALWLARGLIEQELDRSNPMARLPSLRATTAQ